jgi:hypothetical protein
VQLLNSEVLSATEGNENMSIPAAAKAGGRWLLGNRRGQGLIYMQMSSLLGKPKDSWRPLLEVPHNIRCFSVTVREEAV